MAVVVVERVGGVARGGGGGLFIGWMWWWLCVSNCCSVHASHDFLGLFLRLCFQFTNYSLEINMIIIFYEFVLILPKSY